MKLEQTMQIREATIHDILAIQFLLQDEQESKRIFSHAVMKVYVQLGRVLVAEIDKCIVGCVVYRFCRSSQTLINAIHISSFFRELGIEQHLIRTLRNKSIVHGKKKIYAKAPVNSTVNTWYERCGFLEHKRKIEGVYRFWILA